MQELLRRRVGKGRGAIAVGTLLLVAIAAALAPAADDNVTIEPREKWGNVFAGKEVDFHFAVKAPRGSKGRAAWNFSIVNRRTISSGETGLPAGGGKVGVRLRVPEIKDGVVLRARLRISVLAEGEEKAQAVYDKTVWIFPEDPFTGRKKWLKGLKIVLFDPEKTTAGPLKKGKVPFEELNNPAAIGELKEGLLIVGEGVSFRDYPDLGEAMVRAAAGGLPVLCLAPAAGSLALPGADNPRLPAPGGLAFRRADFITELDKRLDAEAWPPEGKVAIRGLLLKAEERTVVTEVTREPGGWPWVEVNYPDHKSKLVVCGFGLLGKAWAAGPTPRFLLARLLEYVAPKAEDEPAREKESQR